MSEQDLQAVIDESSCGGDPLVVVVAELAVGARRKSTSTGGGARV
jgi:hypothetical protein